MDFQELQNAVKITAGKLTVGRDTLTPNLRELIDRCFAGRPIVIADATPGPGDGANATVVIRGRSTFLNVSNLPTVATFSLDLSGNVQLLLKYSLLGAKPGTDDWRFSRSFPRLPQVIDWDKTYADPASVPLDQLALFNAAYIVASQPQTEPEFRVELQAGINFVGRMQPAGIVKAVAGVFGQAQPVTLYGTIQPPTPGQTTPPLPPSQYPWGVAGPIPGIMLQADLGVAWQIGALQLRKIAFRIYTPLTTDWLRSNPTYQPALYYTGALRIPSAALEVDIGIPVENGGNELLLRGRFQGVSLGKLAVLRDIAGTGDLLAHLPDELKKAGDALGKLELIHAAIDLGYDQTDCGILGVSLTVGMPELHWKIWKNHFEVRNLFCRFNIDFGHQHQEIPRVPGPISGKSQITATLYGALEIEKIPCNVWASSAQGFTVYAEMAEGRTIPLQQLLHTYLPGIPAPGDLTVDRLRVGVSAFKSYSMALAMAEKPQPWMIPIGPAHLTVSDITLLFSDQIGGTAAGSFGGTIALGNFASMTIRYDIPGDVLIRGRLPEVGLRQLVGVLTNQKAIWPGAFDLQFTDSAVLLQKKGRDYLFQLATEVNHRGSLAFQVQKIGDQWGFAAGLDLSLGKPSDLSGLGCLKFFEELFTLRQFLLVVSSFDSPGFQFPDLSAFQNPDLSAKELSLPDQADGVVAGVNLYAEWVINTADRQQKLLQNLLGLDPVLGITLQVSENPARASRLYVDYSTTICGHPMRCQFGGQSSDGSIGLFLNGTVTVNIQGHPQTFEMTLLFVANGALISAVMKGQTAVDFEVFKLGNLALEIGVDWEGLPSLGVAGTLDVDRYESSLAVFFDSAEPQKSMVAGALCDLNLKDVLDTLTGETIPSEIDAVLTKVAIGGTHDFTIAATLAVDLNNLQLDRVAAAFQSEGQISIPSQASQVLLVVNTPGSLWYLTDLTTMKHYQLQKKNDKIRVALEAQLYCAPQDTNIGSVKFPQGFFIDGRLDFFGLDLTTAIEISINKGIAVDAAMDKIVIGNATFFSIVAQQGDGGPAVSIATFTQPNQPDEALRPPHFLINGRVQILGLSESVYVNVTSKGLEFDFKNRMNPLLSYDLHGSFVSLTQLNAGGSIKVGIPPIDLGKLGKINLETGVDGTLDLGVNGADIYSKLQAGFALAGERLTLPELALDIRTASLRQLPELLGKKVKEFFKELFTDPEKWAKYAANEIIEDVEDIAKVLTEVFGKTAKEAVDIIAKVTNKVCSVTTALFHM
jgi:hypothetical protein